MTRKRYITTIKSCSECPFIWSCNTPGRVDFVRMGKEEEFPPNCPLNDANPFETETTFQWKKTGGY